MGRNYYNFVKKNPNYLPPQEPGNDETFKAKKKASGRSDDSILSETSSICYAFLVTGQSEHVIDIYNNHPGEHICRMAALARFYQGDYDKAKQIISSHRMNNYGDIDIKNLDATLIQKKIKDPVGLLTDLHDEFFYSIFSKSGIDVTIVEQVIGLFQNVPVLDAADVTTIPLEEFWKNNLYIAYNNLALYQLFKGDLDKAKLASDYAVKDNHGNPFSIFVRALILYELGDEQNALQQVQRLKAPQKFEPNHNSIRALMDAGICKIPSKLVPKEIIAPDYLLTFLNQNKVSPIIIESLRERCIIA